MPLIPDSLAPRALRRLSVALAAVAGGALLAGCGAAATTTGTSSTTPANAFNPQLVSPVTTTTSVSTSATPARRHKSKAKSHAKSGGSHPAKASTTPAPVTAKPVTSSSSGGSARTITVTRTITVVHNVAAPVAAVPAGAHVPSSQAALGFADFSAPGGNIGCRLGGGAARCDISSSNWPRPAKPRSCGAYWGQGLAVGPSGGGHFVCAADSVLDPAGSVVPDGRDDRVGSVTCQVRTIGVTCFDAGGDGFFIGRTGFYTF